MIGTWNLFVLNMFRGCWKIQQNAGALDLGTPLLQLSSHLSINDSGRKRVSGVGCCRRQSFKQDHPYWANYSDLSRGHPKWWWFSKGIPSKMPETCRFLGFIGTICSESLDFDL